MPSKKVAKPLFTLTYEGKNITEDIAPFLRRIQYRDKLHGESSDLQFTLENRDRRWMGAWLPSKGDLVRFTIKYEGGEVLDCGEFEFDEARYSGPEPDIVVLKFLATSVLKDLRTERTEPFEDTTLKAIVDAVADRHGLNVVGDIPSVQIERVTQDSKTDLQFLMRLADEYDLVLRVQGSNLVFYNWDELQSQSILQVVDLSMLAVGNGYDIPWKFTGVYKEAQFSYQNPDSKEEIKFSHPDPLITQGDVLKVNDRAENEQQAREKAIAALEKENRKQVEATFNLAQGYMWAIAGAVLDFTDLGQFSGQYLTLEATHTLSGQGWEASIKSQKTERIASGG